MDSRFDDLLHTVIVEKGQGIYGFFDTVFGFMYRRTDLFYEMAPGENMGFFPGQAEAIVYNFFRKYQNLHYKERVPKRNIDSKEIEDHLKKQKETKENPIPLVNKTNLPADNKVQEIEIKTDNKQSTETSIKKETHIKNETKVEKTVNEKLDDSISTYNGDKCEKYNWSQGVMDVTIQIKLPEGTTKKMFDVKMSNSNFKLTLKSQPNTPYLEGEFCEKIKAEESNWSLEDNKNLILFIEKGQEIIWKSAFKGHKEIDTKTVDNSKRIDEFDNDTQAALNKIVYEQNRKKNGLLTTEEEKKMKALKDAWDAPDSPFKGQPFDPSQFNLNEPIYFNTPDYEAKLRNQKEKENQNK
jgi:hypothetical protein